MKTQSSAHCSWQIKVTSLCITAHHVSSSAAHERCHRWLWAIIIINAIAALYCEILAPTPLHINIGAWCSTSLSIFLTQALVIPSLHSNEQVLASTQDGKICGSFLLGQPYFTSHKDDTTILSIFSRNVKTWLLF